MNMFYKQMNNIIYCVKEIPDSDNNKNEVFDINEIVKTVESENIDIKLNEMVAMELFFHENYIIKDLQKIAGYYNISTRKMKKDDIIRNIVEFESNIENREIVSKRKLLQFYYEELKSDPFFSTYVSFN